MSDEAPPAKPAFPVARFFFLTLLAAGGIAGVLALAFRMPLGSGVENSDYLFIGRFHPLVVHLPIGLILLAALFEFLGFFRPCAHLKSAVLTILLFAALSAGLAVFHGVLLASGGGDTSETLEDHLWAGVALAIGAFLLLPLKVLASASLKSLWSTLYTLGLWGTVALLVIASHLGGNLTHGSDYLVKYMPENWKQTIAKFPAPIRDFIGVKATDATVADAEPTLYDALIAPAFEDHCISCHNADKHKGGLRMDSLAELMKGGDSGSAIALGDLKKSEIHVRVTLPKSDDEFMPPDNKPPLSKEQLATLTWWIESKLPGETLASAIPSPPAEVKKQLDAFLAKRQEKAKAAATVAAGTPAPDPAAELAAMEKTLAKINEGWSGRLMPISRQPADGLALITAGAGSSFDDQALARMAPVAARLRDIDLSRTGVTDGGLAVLAEAREATKLRLDNTGVGAAGVTLLAPMDKLESLNLFGTAVDDQAIQPLTALKGLKKLYVGSTKVTPAGIEKLRAALPECEVIGDLPLLPPPPPPAVEGEKKPAAQPSPKPAEKPAQAPAAAPAPAPAAQPTPAQPTPPPAANPQ